MKIVTDSAADLTPAEVQSLGLSIAPMVIQFPEGEKKSEELDPDEFYNRLEAMQPIIPTTAQPSPGIFAGLYQKILATGEGIISIHISSGLSGTVNAARSGAQIAMKAVHIIDTLTLSGGERFQVLAAARAIQAGWPVEVIRNQLGKIRAQTEVIYTLDTLKYLERGGRIGRVQSLASSLLNIKPIITVDNKDGKYDTLGKSRTIQRALQDINEHLAALYDHRPVWVSVMHGKFEDKAVQLAELLKGTLRVARMEILRVSPVLGVHTGPAIVGAAVVPFELMEEIQ